MWQAYAGAVFTATNKYIAANNDHQRDIEELYLCLECLGSLPATPYSKTHTLLELVVIGTLAIHFRPGRGPLECSCFRYLLHERFILRGLVVCICRRGLYLYEDVGI